jgi:dihydromonapterin reductase / dihydrofolate reductase
MNPAAPIADAVLVTGAGWRIGLHLAGRMLDQQRPVIAHFHR